MAIMLVTLYSQLRGHSKRARQLTVFLFLVAFPLPAYHSATCRVGGRRSA
ncbi:MAG: hypothetical protein ABI625_09355 [bacterium]